MAPCWWGGRYPCKWPSNGKENLLWKERRTSTQSPTSLPSHSAFPAIHSLTRQIERWVWSSDSPALKGQMVTRCQGLEGWHTHRHRIANNSRAGTLERLAVQRSLWWQKLEQSQTQAAFTGVARWCCILNKCVMLEKHLIPYIEKHSLVSTEKAS